MNSKILVLVIDDEPEILMLAEMRLKANGYDVVSVLNGSKAIETIDQMRPDLILLDLLMPGMDGFEVCENIKNNDKTKDIPIIIVTAASGTPDISERCYAAGADGIIAKPYNAQELIDKIKKQLGE